jgi:hypothetical protein
MEWISVKDRLPEFEFPILFYSEKYGVQKGFRITGRGKRERFRMYASGLNLMDVTHWMSLPQPPKQ